MCVCMCECEDGGWLQGDEPTSAESADLRWPLEQGLGVRIDES